MNCSMQSLSVKIHNKSIDKDHNHEMSSSLNIRKTNYEGDDEKNPFLKN